MIIWRPVTPETVSIIYYSSGTTGQPKGVVLTHKAIHCQVEMLRRCAFLFSTRTPLFSHWLHEIYPVLGMNEVDWYQVRLFIRRFN